MPLPQSVIAIALTTVCAAQALAGDTPASGEPRTFKEGPRQLTVWQVPNVPQAAEPYYASDNRTLIAQVQDKAAIRAKEGASGGALTWTFTDRGENLRRINDLGQDGCSYFFPDMQRLVFTSTRDNVDKPVGNWSDPKDYPAGAELYMASIDGGNLKRLTQNSYYDAEISVSPDGQWIVFGRQIDGNMDLWRMRADGTGEERITNTPDWQEGRPMYLPDSETVMFRAWKTADFGVKRPTPMTVFTIRHDGTALTPRTFDENQMNWSSYPAPDGRHFAAVRIVANNNWEIFLYDMEQPDKAPERLTWNESFDGFPSFSPDGTKMAFARSTGQRFMSDNFVHIMDVSSLDIGPKARTGATAGQAK
ncbi:MAG: PD40 domain-containing protein [Gammaproteobacteria bacterium]|nr:PD40 domain-containing protein [Gammaproteobacteria bacterium]